MNKELQNNICTETTLNTVLDDNFNKYHDMQSPIEVDIRTICSIEVVKENAYAETYLCREGGSRVLIKHTVMELMSTKRTVIAIVIMYNSIEHDIVFELETTR